MEDHIIIMDRRAKRNYGILSLLPVVAWGTWFFYYLFALSSIIRARDFEDHIAVATSTAQHYHTSLVIAAIAAIVSAIVLIVFIIHVAQLKKLNGPTKTMWILILAALVPFSFPLFWFLHIRNESTYQPVHPDIA